ncbi:MAG: ArsA family ATPase [Acidimicrobiales bacterium]
MDVRTFCSRSHVLIVAGKGGVGKTTLVAAIARMAADAGLSVLVVELEGREGVSDAFGHLGHLDYAGATLSSGSEGETRTGETEIGNWVVDDDPVPAGNVQARRITPDDALLEYLADHGLRRVSKRLMSSGIIDIVSGAIPGIKDILVLGKVKQIELSGAADLVLVDAPATGHVMTFLSSASGLLDAARGGPVRTQAADVVAMLTDPKRCQVALVTLPEEMPVNEAIEAAYQLEDKVGISLGPIIVNGCYPSFPASDIPAARAAAAAGITLDDEICAAIDAASAFRHTRESLQRDQVERLRHELPLPQLRVPFAFTASIGPEELQVLANALEAAVTALPDPDVTTS